MGKLKWFAVAVGFCAAGSAVACVLQNRLLVFVSSIAILLVSLLLLLSVIREEKLVAYLVRENKQWQSKVIFNNEDIEQMEKSRKQSELSALQYQINPHFLYNTLDTIRGQALLDDKQDIAQMTERLSRFFRYSISNRSNIVRVEEEIRHIEDYLYIQKKRFGDRFEAEIFVESHEINEFYMLKLLLQPLVENAITHGLEHMRKNGLVTIRFMKTDKKLLIYIADNGAGISEDKLYALNETLKTSQVFVPENRGRHTGIAIQNVNARIRMTFGEEYGMHYRSEPNKGTIVAVALPLVDDFQRIQYEEDKL